MKSSVEITLVDSSGTEFLHFSYFDFEIVACVRMKRGHDVQLIETGRTGSVRRYKIHAQKFDGAGVGRWELLLKTNQPKRSRTNKFRTRWARQMCAANAAKSCMRCVGTTTGCMWNETREWGEMGARQGENMRESRETNFNNIPCGIIIVICNIILVSFNLFQIRCTHALHSHAAMAVVSVPVATKKSSATSCGCSVTFSTHFWMSSVSLFASIFWFRSLLCSV